jgi:hypothetical protein
MHGPDLVCMGARGQLGDLPITCMQAPFKQNTVAGGQEAFLSFTHLLKLQCFSDSDELQV